MPIDPTQLHRVLQVEIPKLLVYQQSLDLIHQAAMQTWTHPPLSQDELTARATHLVQVGDRLVRVAIPTGETYNQQFEAGLLPERAYQIAVDGSQVHPSPTSQYAWSLINLGSCTWQWHQDHPQQSIQIRVQTQLFLGNQQLTQDGLVQTPEHVDLLRDVAERTWLAEMAVNAARQHDPVIAYLDGPAELYGARDPRQPGSFRSSLRRVEEAYQALAGYDVPLVGYVASARSTLLVRLLEVATLSPEKVAQIRAIRPYDGLTDEMLLTGWLRPGARTAVFRIGTRSQGVFAGKIALHTFYANVGDEDNPQIVRIEIPAWVAERPELLGEIHALLLMQCSALAGSRYPYQLIRADEAARVSPAEMLTVGEQITAALLRAGVRPQTLTAKLGVKRAARKWQR